MDGAAGAAGLALVCTCVLEIRWNCVNVQAVCVCLIVCVIVGKQLTETEAILIREESRGYEKALVVA